ncbi:MAG TPA: hypothetical protein K8W15_03705 [Gallibacterium anatis]|uniref:Uncharacterized protein n=1 Tax=Gallibacterium anatis TaxID=750 RepID=A0A921L0U2_9PAST|nr:hypothetical protein [Gallibacterium anatis]
MAKKTAYERYSEEGKKKLGERANKYCSDPLNQQSLIGFFAKTGGNP